MGFMHAKKEEFNLKRKLVVFKKRKRVFGQQVLLLERIFFTAIFPRVFHFSFLCRGGWDEEVFLAQE